jgi:hypothetical protein
LRDHEAVVSAYYLSNVEDYLSRDRTWLNFCANAATLPLDAKSTFIRSGGGYRPSTFMPSPTVTMTPAQVGRIVAQGVPTVSLPDGRAGTVVTRGGVLSLSVGMGPANKLGLMQDDLAPCAVPKFSPAR